MEYHLSLSDETTNGAEQAVRNLFAERSQALKAALWKFRVVHLSRISGSEPSRARALKRKARTEGVGVLRPEKLCCALREAGKVAFDPAALEAPVQPTTWNSVVSWTLNLLPCPGLDGPEQEIGGGDLHGKT